MLNGEEFRKAAEKGDADAQYKLGLCYHSDQNYSEAIKWYRKAAEQNFANAQLTLGNFYEHGLGVTQDYSEAIRWYKKAAEQGNATAQLILGICYHNGKIVAEDYGKAIYWYRKAAAQGNEDAKEILKGIDFDTRMEYKDEENSNRHSDSDGCIASIIVFFATIGLIISLIRWLSS